jgi:hypothetical protein
LDCFEEVGRQGGEVFHGEWGRYRRFKLAGSIVQKIRSNWEWKKG